MKKKKKRNENKYSLVEGYRFCELYPLKVTKTVDRDNYVSEFPASTNGEVFAHRRPSLERREKRQENRSSLLVLGNFSRSPVLPSSWSLLTSDQPVSVATSPFADTDTLPHCLSEES